MTARSVPMLWRLKNPLTLSVIVTYVDDDLFVAEFPALPGCRAEGETFDKAVWNLAKAIQAAYEEHFRGAA
jgi:predicted RNase H-like HicB family nuclease